MGILMCVSAKVVARLIKQTSIKTDLAQKGKNINLVPYYDNFFLINENYNILIA